MSSNVLFNVTIFRDGLYTPWGFRLEGGKDSQSPLIIQRVFQGSPSSGYLQRGDVVLSIQNKDAKQLFQHEVNELIRKAGGSLQLTIQRGHFYSGFGSDGTAVNRSAIITHYEKPKNMNINFYQSAVHHAEYDHANARVYDPADPLASLVRNRIIERVHDPKPILSQTGSPMLPSLPEYSNPRTSILNMRRYQSSRTLPNVNAKPVAAPLQAYQEKEMIDKIQTSLQRYAPSRPSSAIFDYPFPLSSPNQHVEVNYTQGNKSAQQESSNQNFGNVGPLSIMNNQYNSPIGLYSRVSGKPAASSAYELPATDF